MSAPVAQAPVPPVPSDPLKAGYKSTEFWVAGVFPAVFLLLSQLNIFHIDTNNPHVEAYTKLGGYIFAGLGAAFYAWSRGHMKAGAALKVGLGQLGGSLENAAVTRSAAPDFATLENSVASEIKAFDPLLSEAQLEQIGSLVGDIVHSHVSAAVDKLTPNPVTVVVNQADTATPDTTTPVTDMTPVSNDPAQFVAPTFS